MLKNYGFSTSHVQLWELDRKEGWVPKNWCFWTVVLEKTLESLLDSKEIQPVNPIGNQPWLFIGRTDAEAEAPILGPCDAKSWLTGKSPWCWERLRAGEEGGNRRWDVGWHHRHNGYEFEYTLWDSEEQGSLVYCSPCGHKESDTT